MLTVKNKVNSYLVKRLTEDEDAPYKSENSLYFSSTSQFTPEKFPTLNVKSLGEVQATNDLLRNKQNFIISTIELKAYSNTSVTECHSLIDKAGDVMLEMGYAISSGPEEISDTYKIVYARFSRLVGSGDTLY